MKRMKWLYTCFFTLLLLGCYEVTEEVVINQNGSGTYNVKMDMGQLLEMMQSFATEEDMAKEGMDKKMDTVILFKDIMDSVKDLTPKQKELMKDGKLRLQMDMKEKLFKITTDFKFKNYDELQQLMMGDGTMSGMSDALKSIFGQQGPKEDTTVPDRPVDPDMNAMSKVYDVTVKNGLISKKINPEKMKALMEKPEMAQVQQLTSSGMEIQYTTTFKLPRPVKKSDNPLIKLSEDKKTVTIKYNLLEMFDNPEKFSFSIEY